MSGLYGGWRSCTILCFAKNCCARFLFKIYQTVVLGIPRSFSSLRTVNRRSPTIVSRTRSMFSGVVVNESRPERGSLSTDVRPFLNRLYNSFICVMPILSSTKSPYNSCRDWSRTWCKFVDLFFLSFSTVNKCDQGIWSVTTAFTEFVRDYWLRSFPGAFFSGLETDSSCREPDPENTVDWETIQSAIRAILPFCDRLVTPCIVLVKEHIFLLHLETFFRNFYLQTHQ